MARHEIAFAPHLPLTPLAEYDPAATAFIDNTFAGYEAQVAAVGERAAVWPGDEVVTHTGMYVARLLDRDTIIYDREYPGGSSAHSEQFVISDEIVLGNRVYSGGVDPTRSDWEDHGHNDDIIFCLEALMPDGRDAPVSVRIGLRREAAAGGLMVASDLASIDEHRFRLFNPTFYNATPEPLIRD